MRLHYPITPNLTPPAVAKRFGVATKKVIEWIKSGELRALNLARRGSTMPRYSIPPEAIDDFERGRQVVPDGGLSTTKRRRRQAQPGAREYF